MKKYTVPSASSTNPTVCSFDVFDTVLTRAVSPPTAAFLLVGKRAAHALPVGCTPRAFAEARQAAEQRVLRWHGARMTLDAIYHELQTNWPGATTDWSQIQAMELAVERDLLTPVPVGCDLVQQCREAGHRVIFVSDMYLPSAFIQEQLETHGLWQANDQLFVSCEYGCKKGSGLFKVVYETLHITPDALTHYGNCRHADVAGARAHGSTGVHVTEANSNRYEAALERQSEPTGGLSALIAGASRHARLHTSASTQHEQALRSGAASVLAPVCTAFAIWLLQQAQANDLERLYFTSRDGHVLLPIARRLAPLMGIDCELRYLYLSRVSMATANPNPEMLHRSWESEAAPVHTVIQRLNLDAAAGDGAQAEKQTLTAFLGTQNGAVATALHERRQVMCQYLRQEGLDMPPRSGFVDVGWKGTVHSLLNGLLLDEGMIDAPLPGFFFGLSAKQQPYAAHRTAYFFDEHRSTGHRNVLRGSGIYTLLETFCTADHGSVVGYERKDGMVQPVLEPSWPERVATWGLPVVREAVDAFLDGLTRHAELLHTSADLRPAMAEVIQQFWRSPTAHEAEAWGQFPREQGHAHDQGAKPLAPRYPWKAPFAFARYGPQGHEQLTHKFSWPAASLHRSRPLVRGSILAVLTARTGAKRIYHAVRRRLPAGAR